MEKESFLRRVQKLSDDVRNEPHQETQKVMLPNDPEIEVSKNRMKKGIPIDHETFNKLFELSNEYSIELKKIAKH